MTKAEKAEYERVATEAALRWPTEAEPQPVTTEYIKANLEEVSPRAGRLGVREVFKGWVFNCAGSRVEPAWSNGFLHGWGNWTGDSASQTMGRLYRTEREATLAMRWEMCRQMAERLRSVDARLAHLHLKD
jgi:hypothetical protein